MKRLSCTAVLVALVCLGSSGIARAAAGVVQVTDPDIGVSWFTADTRTGGAVTLAPGPDVPPLGIGSAQFVTDSTIDGSGKAKAQLVTYDYVGTPLSSIDALSFWAYRSSSSTNSAAQTVGLNVEVDFVGDGSSYTTLVYEPVYQPGGVGAIATDTWQLWDAFDGGNAIWWSTKDIPGLNAFTFHTTWAEILADNPDAKVVGLVGFNLGSGWEGLFHGAADALAVGVSGDLTTYDFDPYVPPRAVKEGALADAQALGPTGDKKTDHELDKAANAIAKSLDDRSWEDDEHLTNRGANVFAKEKGAVAALMKVVGTVPGAQAVIDALVGVDRALAQIALDDAIARDGKAGNVQKAQDALAKGDAYAADGSFDRAVDEYKKCWIFAHKA